MINGTSPAILSADKNADLPRIAACAQCGNSEILRVSMPIAYWFMCCVCDWRSMACLIELDSGTATFEGAPFDHDSANIRCIGACLEQNAIG